MQFSLVKPNLNSKGVAVFPIFDDLKLAGYLNDIPAEANLQSIVKSSKTFKGKSGDILAVPLPSGTKFEKIILLGLGAKGSMKADDLRLAGAKLAAAINSMHFEEACFFLNESLCSKSFCHRQLAEAIAEGAESKTYNYNKLFHDKAAKHKLYLKSLSFTCDSNDKELKERLDRVSQVGDGVNLTRDLVTMPPNLLNPATFADGCKKLKKVGLKVTVLDKKKLTALGMNALLGVCQGSHYEAKVVVMEWYGSKNKKDSNIAFVGKGVTFDSGGLSLKPSASMEDMKYDMGGAGVVTGLMKALANRKANVNAVGVIGLVENMPSGTAQRPGDVVKSMSGQTIEILNTDAEGRLVLADVLWYTQEKFKPTHMINLATLTGAVVMALGENLYSGIFSNSDELSKMLTNAGNECGEKVWRLPLCDFFDQQIDSEIADMRNTGSGRGAGSITAAQFLQRFVKEETKWVHIDIAGVTWDKKGSGINPKGATGYGVRLLDKVVEKYFEK